MNEVGPLKIVIILFRPREPRNGTFSKTFSASDKNTIVDAVLLVNLYTKGICKRFFDWFQDPSLWEGSEKNKNFNEILETDIKQASGQLNQNIFEKEKTSEKSKLEPS